MAEPLSPVMVLACLTISTLFVKPYPTSYLTPERLERGSVTFDAGLPAAAKTVYYVCRMSTEGLFGWGAFRMPDGRAIVYTGPARSTLSPPRPVGFCCEEPVT